MTFEGLSVNNQEGGNKHQKVVEYFRSLSPFDTKLIEQLQEMGKIDEIKKLEEGKEKINDIISSLEAGDKEPARARLRSMIEKNVGNFKVFDTLSPEARAGSLEGLRDLVEQLIELERE